MHGHTGKLLGNFYFYCTFLAHFVPFSHIFLGFCVHGNSCTRFSLFFSSFVRLYLFFLFVLRKQSLVAFLTPLFYFCTDVYFVIYTT